MLDKLKQFPQWINWKYGKPDSKGKRAKIPLNPHTGKPIPKGEGGTEYKNVWAAFDVAFERNAKYVGFVFSKDANPFVGVDLDNAAENGILKPWAAEIVKELNSYTEWSPSGTGVHIILEGKVQTITPQPYEDGKIEAYSEGRYFTFTFNPYLNVPIVKSDLAPITKRVRPVTVADVRKHGAPEGARSNSLAKIIGRYHHDGLSYDEAWAALRAFNNKKMQPPYDEKDLEIELKSAYKRYDAKEGDPKNPEYPAALFVSARDFFKRSLAEEEWLIEGIATTESLGMVFGARGKGKTFLMMDLARALTTGTPWLPWKIQKARRVLYIDGEMPEKKLLRRLKEMTEVNDLLDLLPSSEWRHHGERKMRLNDPGDQKRFLASLKMREEAKLRPEIIIFDNLSSMTFGTDESSNSDQDSFMDFLFTLRDLKYSVIFVHHTGKSGTQRGASRREDFLDWVVKLKNPEEPSRNAKFVLDFLDEQSKTREKAPDIPCIEVELGPHEKLKGRLAFRWTEVDHVQEETGGPKREDKRKKLKEVIEMLLKIDPPVDSKIAHDICKKAAECGDKLVYTVLSEMSIESIPVHTSNHGADKWVLRKGKEEM